MIDFFGLGTSEYSLQTLASVTQHTGRPRRPARSTIDLTTPSRPALVNEDCVVLHEYTKVLTPLWFFIYFSKIHITKIFWIVFFPFLAQIMQER